MSAKKHNPHLPKSRIGKRMWNRLTKKQQASIKNFRCDDAEHRKEIKDYKS